MNFSELILTAGAYVEYAVRLASQGVSIIGLVISAAVILGARVFVKQEGISNLLQLLFYVTALFVCLLPFMESALVTGDMATILQATQLIPWPAGIIASLIAGVMFVIIPVVVLTAILQFLGVIESKEKKQAAMAAKQGSPAQLRARAYVNRELAAIMLTDIVGYSKQMGANERDALERLMAHNNIIKRQITPHRGQIVKTMGDAFLVRFKSAVDATKCAIDCQRALYKFNEGKDPSKQVHIRVGVHLGDIVLSNNDVFGDGVNVAARIQPLAQSDGICVSADVVNAVKNKVDATFESIGVKELKNIENPPELFNALFDLKKDPSTTYKGSQAEAAAG